MAVTPHAQTQADRVNSATRATFEHTFGSYEGRERGIVHRRFQSLKREVDHSSSGPLGGGSLLPRRGLVTINCRNPLQYDVIYCPGPAALSDNNRLFRQTGQDEIVLVRMRDEGLLLLTE